MKSTGEARDLATLMAGEFFGEAALLSREPRNASVTAVTPCTLYKLHRDDLRVAMANNRPFAKRWKKKAASVSPCITPVDQSEHHGDVDAPV